MLSPSVSSKGLLAARIPKLLLLGVFYPNQKLALMYSAVPICILLAPLNFSMEVIFKSFSLALLSLIGLFLNASPALTKPVPDGTLGSESSQVTSGFSPTGTPAEIIDGGAARGDSLFHSFLEFDIDTGQQVYFANPADISRIFTRVTGGETTNIDGTLGIDGSADLFLLSPNGILFGPNARLDLQGSFVSTTAESVVFEDGSIFSADSMAESPLLTISTPIGLQFGDNPGPLVNQANAELSAPGTLAFIAGDISIPGGTISSASAIELASLDKGAVVSLLPVEDGYRFDYSRATQRQDIVMTDAYVGVADGNGGRVHLIGDNITLAGSTLVAEGTTSSETGEGIAVQTNTLRLQDSAKLGALALDGGQASSDILIQAAQRVEIVGNIEVVGFGEISGSRGGILNTDGDIRIFTSQLSMSKGSTISAGLLSGDRPGTIYIEAEDIVLSDLFTTISSDGFDSVGGDGFSRSSGGDIILQTERLLIQKGASISSVGLNTAEAGNITIDASDWIKISGVSDQPFLETTPVPSSILTSSLSNNNSVTSVSGNGGTITINAPNLSILEGGQISSDIDKAGNGGVIVLSVENTVVINGRSTFPDPTYLSLYSGVYTETSGTGNAGSIIINALDLQLLEGLISADTQGTGAGGDISINVQRLQLRADSRIQSDSLGSGNGGDVTVNAVERAQILGGDPADNPTDEVVTGISASALRSGNGGSVFINTGELLITQEGFVGASTISSGDAGSVLIKAADEVRLVGQSVDLDGFQTAIVVAAVDNDTTDGLSLGRAGELVIEAPQILLEEGAIFSVRSSGGPAGNISLEAELIRLDNDALITATTFDDSEGANIFLRATDALIIGNDSQITATAFESANGGNIDIKAGFVLALPATGADGNDIVARAVEGDGGRIFIRADAIYGLAERSAVAGNGTNDIDASSDFGGAGEISIVTPEIEPNTDATDLPATTAQAEFQSGCQTVSDTSQFIASGRGGLAAAPSDLLSADGPWQDVRSPIADNTKAENTDAALPVEATEWQVDESGQVQLMTGELSTCRARQ